MFLPFQKQDSYCSEHGKIKNGLREYSLKPSGYYFTRKLLVVTPTLFDKEPKKPFQIKLKGFLNRIIDNIIALKLLGLKTILRKISKYYITVCSNIVKMILLGKEQKKEELGNEYTNKREWFKSKPTGRVEKIRKPSDKALVKAIYQKAISTPSPNQNQLKTK